MKKIIVFLLAFFIAFTISAKELELEWIKGYGDTEENAYLSVISTKDEGYVAVGYTNLPVSTRKSYNTQDTPIAKFDDALIVKYDKDGNVLWDKTFGGSDDDRFWSVIETQDGDYIAVGETWSSDIEGVENKGRYDALLVKYDKDGNIIWQKSFGGSKNDKFYSIAKTQDGDYIAVGETCSSDIEGLEEINKCGAIVVKYNKDGNVLWKKVFYTNESTYFSVIETEDKNIVCVGKVRGNIDGLQVQKSTASPDSLIVKYDKDGNEIWKKSFGGSEGDRYTSVVETKDKGYAVVGNTESTDIENLDINDSKQFIILKYDKDGNVIWMNSFEGLVSDALNNLIETQDGNLLTNGFVLNSNGNPNPFLIEFDSNGKEIMRKELSSVGGVLAALAEDGNKSIACAGAFASSTLDGLENKGNADALIVKYSYTYNVEKVESENGTFELDKTSGRNGELINVTVNPNENYEFSHLLVTVGTIDYEVKDTKFYIPASDVKVKAIFTLKKFEVKAEENNKGTVELSVPNAPKGTKVTFKTLAKKGYKVAKVVVLDTKGNEIEVNTEDNSFIMPEDDVILKVTYEEIIENPKTGFINMTLIMSVICGLSYALYRNFKIKTENSVL